MSRYRKKPLAQFEHGTRIYAPTANEPRYRVVATDPTNDERIFVKCPSEEHARAKAHNPGTNRGGTGPHGATRPGRGGSAPSTPRTA